MKIKIISSILADHNRKQEKINIRNLENSHTCGNKQHTTNKQWLKKEIFSNPKKGENPIICNKMNECEGHYAM